MHIIVGKHLAVSQKGEVTATLYLLCDRQEIQVKMNLMSMCIHHHIVKAYKQVLTLMAGVSTEVISQTLHRYCVDR